MSVPGARGRKARCLLHEHPQLLQQIMGTTDGQPLNPSSSSTNKQGVVFQLACNQHVRVAQLRSAVRNAQRAKVLQQEPTLGYCKVCNIPYQQQGAAHASQLEVVCYEMLMGQLGPLFEWRHEARLLGRPVDVWVPGLKLAVNVDGQHHTPSCSSGMLSTSSTEQARKDEEFNASVMAGQGQEVKGLLRLHHADSVVEWWAKMAQAMSKARDPGVVCFVIFTQAFNKPDTVART
jgi:hypothetical protein